MYDENSQDPSGGDSQDRSSTASRINGLMALANRRQAETQAALSVANEAEADAAAARAELAEVRALLDSAPEPRMDPNRPMRRNEPPPDPMEELKHASWESFGMESPPRR
jgi:hypothetical protein